MKNYSVLLTEVFSLSMEDDAKIIIESVYGSPPDHDSPLYPRYLKAVEFQADHMKRQVTESGIKKLSLGDYSAEYSGSSSDTNSSDVISPYAAAVLDSIYGSLCPAEVVF